MGSHVSVSRKKKRGLRDRDEPLKSLCVAHDDDAVDMMLIGEGAPPRRGSSDDAEGALETTMHVHPSSSYSFQIPVYLAQSERVEGDPCQCHLDENRVCKESRWIGLEGVVELAGIAVMGSDEELKIWNSFS